MEEAKTTNSEFHFRIPKDGKSFIKRHEGICEGKAINIANEQVDAADSYATPPIDALQRHRKVILKRLTDMHVIYAGDKFWPDAPIYAGDVERAYGKEKIKIDPSKDAYGAYLEYLDFQENPPPFNHPDGEDLLIAPVHRYKLHVAQALMEELNVTNQWLARKRWEQRQQSK